MDQSALTFIAEQVTCLNRVRAQKPREVCHRRVADTTMTGTSVQRHTFGNVLTILMHRRETFGTEGLEFLHIPAKLNSDSYRL